MNINVKKISIIAGILVLIIIVAVVLLFFKSNQSSAGSQNLKITSTLVTDFITLQTKNSYFQNYDYLKNYLVIENITNVKKNKEYCFSYNVSLSLQDATGNNIYSQMMNRNGCNDSKKTSDYLFLSSRLNNFNPGQYTLNVRVYDSYSKIQKISTKTVTVVASDVTVSEPVITDVNAGSSNQYNLIPVFNKGDVFDVYFEVSGFSKTSMNKSVIITGVKITNVKYNTVILDTNNFASDILTSSSIFSKRFTINTTKYDSGIYSFKITALDFVSNKSNSKYVVLKIK